MKPSVIAVSLSLLFLTTAGGQTRTSCPITIPAGAITNDEYWNLTVKTSESATGMDPAFKAFGQRGDDIRNAHSFYVRVANTAPVLEDETLRIVDEEVLYGEALACQGKNCHLIFIRPITQIAHHWLVTLQRDFKEFEEAASSTASAKFVADSKTADEQKDSVWSKLSALYCHLEPDGKYRDLGGSVVFCRDLR